MATNYNYQQQLNTPQWRDVRDSVLIRDKRKCTLCNCPDRLEVHHRYYENGLRAWEYPLESLATLCSDCHEGEDEFRILLFRKAPKDKHETLRLYLRNGWSNCELWFRLIERLPASRPLDEEKMREIEKDPRKFWNMPDERWQRLSYNNLGFKTKHNKTYGVLN